MKMIMIVYNEAMDDEVMEVLQSCSLTNYTKFVGVFGKGTTSGTHRGDDIWPGRNNVLLVACDDAVKERLLGCTRTLRARLGQEGVKAFVLPLEELT